MLIIPCCVLIHMPKPSAKGKGTKEDPWVLKTPSGESEFMAYRELTSSPPAIVVNVGETELRYHARCIEDLQAMLKAYGDWMPLGMRMNRNRPRR